MSERTSRLPGERAQTPAQIPPKGWWQITRRALKESSADNVPILAAGVAFAAFLAVFPALIAAISMYGLVADPAQVAQQVEALAGGLPQQAQSIVRDEIAAVASAGGGALTLGLVLSLLVALWSASSGTSSLMTAINLAYDENEERGFLKLRGIALALTLGAIVFVLVTLALVAVVPPLLNALQLGLIGRIIAQIVRWTLLVGLIVVALAIMYWAAPDRDPARFAWVSPGALVAAALWLLGSIGFSLYVNNFGSYNETYGALAGVVVLMLWFYLSTYVVLLGAEINAEAEKQTARDTTQGDREPMGERGAVPADTLARPS
jgi:membrane protein